MIKLIIFFTTIISCYYCISQNKLPSKHPWNPLPVTLNRLINNNNNQKSLSSLSSAASITSSTVYLPEKKSSDVSFETHDKTYSIESSHFRTPIIEHHPNGATVGLDLPEANIRLLLDIDQLGGKPVAQHIGLKVVEKNKQNSNSKQLTSGSIVKSEPIKVNNLNHQQKPRHQPTTSNHNSFGSSALPTINHQTTLKSSSASPISPQLTTIGRSSKIVSIPVSTNYKIGYIRTNDLHSAIHHQIVHGKGGNQVSVLSGPVNYGVNHQSSQPINSQNHRFTSKQLENNPVNQGGFVNPRLESGSFKPIESYSNQMKQFEGQIKINNSFSSTIKKSSLQTPSKLNLASPVNIIKGKLRPINNLKETEQIKEPIQQQINGGDEQINSNDFIESDLQSKLESPPVSSMISNSRNQRSPKKLDKLQEVNESTSIWNSGSNSGSSLVDNSNDIVNSDEGFDEDEDVDENNGNSNDRENESTVNDNNRINNHKTETVTEKSANNEEIISGKLALPSPSSSSLNGQCDLKFSRCPMSCQTITEPLISSSSSSLTLESIASTLGADLLLNAIPSSQSIIQSLIDSSTSGYTLFLPSNEALAKLPGNLINRWKSDSSGLNSLLTNHFIDTQITLENLKSMTGISLKSGTNQLQFGIFRNETYTVNGQQISIGNQRSPNNGIIHIIEGILYPSADKNIMETLKSCNKFDGFVTLAMGTGLGSTLSRGGPYTVFVPSNEALQKIPEKDLQLVRANMTALKDMLAYHVVPGLYYSSHLMDGQFINSLQSSLPIKVGVRVDRCSRRLVEVNMSPVYGVDIPASNGVIHVIDWIIKPNDNDWCDDVIFPR